MHSHRNLFPALPILLACAFLGAAAEDPATAIGSKADSRHEENAWVLAYFRQRYDSRVEVDAEGRTHNVPLPHPMRVEQLHLALSIDGRHWTPLNRNRPVWDQWLRDPFLQRGRDGRWHLLATGGAGRTRGTASGPTCLHAVSRDLVTWQDVRSLTLMEGVRDETGRAARNIWAPEWFLDRDTEDVVVIWSSSFEDAGWKKSRLWWARTRDWQVFTRAQVFFDPPYSVIDGTLLQHDGTFFLFHKEEEFGVATGERRAIRLATAARLEGPYQVHQGPLNGGQIVPTITEGPAVLRDPRRGGWLLLYDFCMTDRYGASSSPDLYQWSVEDDVDFPPDARHGSLMPVTASEAKRLRASFDQPR